MRLGIVLHHHTVTDQAASIIHVITLISKINTYDSVDYEVALSGFAYPETYVFEGFENTTFPPTGWANLGSWSRYTYTVFEGSGSAYKYSSSTTPYILSTPKLNILRDDTLSFMGRISSTSAALDIVYSQDRTTWTVLESINSPSTSAWFEVNINLNIPEGEGNYYLGFRTMASATYYVDNVLMPAFAQEAPNAVTLTSPANAATSQSIKPTLSWTPALTGGIPTSYDIYLEANSDPLADPREVYVNVGSSPFTFTNSLDFGTTYVWKVVAKNALGDSPDNAIRSFSTLSGKATITSPSNNAQTVDIASRKLDWLDVSNATGYKITVGTTEGGTDIANMVDCAISEWTKDSNWEYNTNYYWKVYTLNGVQVVEGDAWTFKTMEDPTMTPPVVEAFTSVPPVNWSKHSGMLADPITLSSTTSGWIADGFTNVGSTGAARLNIFGTSCRYWLITPPINLGDGTVDYELVFDLALTDYGTTGTPDQNGTDDKFAVVISTDNGATWNTANILRLWDNAGSSFVYNEISTSGEMINIGLEAYSGIVKIALYGESTTGNADNDLFVDNFMVREITHDPTFSIDPASWDYGTVQVTMNKAKGFTIRNAGAGTLEIARTDITISGDNADQFSLSPIAEDISLAAGQSTEITVIFNPTSEGIMSAKLNIVDNTEDAKKGVKSGAKARHEIQLTGEGLDATVDEFPWSEGFEEEFPPLGWLNSGWTQSTYGSPHTGTEFAYSNLTGSLLTSAPIALPSVGKYLLEFWYRAESSSYPQDMDVYIIVDGELVSEPILVIDGAVNTTHQKASVSLESYAGSTVNIQFKGQYGSGGYSYGICVDDVGVLETFDYPDGDPITIGEGEEAVTITIDGGNANNVPDGTIPEIPNASFEALGSFVLQLLGEGPWNVTILTSAPWGAYYQGGSWTAVEAEEGRVRFDVEPSKNLNLPILLGNQDPSLPVTLSSFTAVLTANFDVKIAWVAESETNHAGYNILRSETDELDSAIRINREILQEGIVNGSQIKYEYLDGEVYWNSSYHYWLESVSLDGDLEYFGPVMVTINAEGDNEGIPEIPLQTALFSAFPNPFNPSTNLRYAMSEPGDVRIDVFNARGQLLKSFRNTHNVPGYYQVSWDGRDANGRAVSTGVYFYRMQSGKYVSTKKMVLSK